ncbi:MAG: hypothetical protein AAF329_25265 [Cyanobacteria bacterium P01_A01_bin.17]
MNHDFVFGLITTALAVMGGVLSAAAVVTRKLSSIERRFDRIESALTDQRHASELNRTSVQSNLDNLNFRLETVYEYRINANTERIDHKVGRIEKAIATLSGAVEKISDGQYVPRGPNFWPTDNPPTETK